MDCLKGNKMKAVRFYGKEDIRVEDVAAPSGPGAPRSSGASSGAPAPHAAAAAPRRRTSGWAIAAVIVILIIAAVIWLVLSH